MKDAKREATNGVRSWGPGFLPATFQGTPVGDGSGDQRIANLSLPSNVSVDRQLKKLKLIDQINRLHAERLPDVSDLDANSILRTCLSNAK